MAQPKPDLLQGTLDMLLLRMVADRPMHGYAIAKRLQQVSKDVLLVQQGSLYPCLHRLEKRRWLASEWSETESGRTAKFYSLTAAGKRQLGLEAQDWHRLSDAVTLVMKAGSA